MDNKQDSLPWRGSSPLMNKNMAQVFPTYILGYEDPKANDHVPMILEHIQNNEKWTPPPAQPSQTVNNKLHMCPELNSFFNWIDEVLEDCRRTFRWEAERLGVNLAWCNKADSAGQHQVHVHPNSFLSGVYYLSDNSSPTIFEDPRYQTRSGLMLVSHAQPMMSKAWAAPSDKGTLVLFPSWLPHFTEPDPNIPGGEYRYTLSFNSMPFGVSNVGSLIELEH